MDKIEIIECPRDAMQGYSRLFSKKEKLRYLRSLMPVGFSAIDIGSFVSPTAIPQMADTKIILDSLLESKGSNKFLVIAANKRGVKNALNHRAVDIIGYPFSASETFQKRNTNRSRKQAINDLREYSDLIQDNNKRLVIYMSMAFGNPYDENISNQEILDLVGEISLISHFEALSLSDTVAMAKKGSINLMVRLIQENISGVHLGLHLHVPGVNTSGQTLLKEAWNSGIRRYDSALLGFGGCPFAADDLSGNLSTESLITFLASEKVNDGINPTALEAAMNEARDLFL